MVEFSFIRLFVTASHRPRKRSRRRLLATSRQVLPVSGQLVAIAKVE